MGGGGGGWHEGGEGPVALVARVHGYVLTPEVVHKNAPCARVLQINVSECRNAGAQATITNLPLLGDTTHVSVLFQRGKIIVGKAETKAACDVSGSLRERAVS